MYDEEERNMVNKQGESMVASYRYLGVSNPGLQRIGSNACVMFPICIAPKPHSYISEKLLHSIILRHKRF